MPSTYTDSLRVEKQATGENDTTWGTKLNTAIDMIEQAVAGWVSVTHDDTASYTLSTANGTSDEARNMTLHIAGTLTAARNVVCPTKEKLYVIKNGTTGGFAVTLKTSGGTGIAVPNGHTMILYCDGTNVLSAVATNEVGGFKNLLINPLFVFDKRNGGASTAVSDDNYAFDRVNILTQTASVNVSQVTAPEDGYTHAIRLTQNQVAAQRMGFSQLIEGRNCKHLRGQQATLSGRIRCSSSQAIRYAILEWTGTEDSPVSDPVNDWTSATYTVSNFFKATTTTVVAVGSITPSANTWTALTALTGTISSSLTNLLVMVWTEGTAAQNVTLDCDTWQLEKGAIATEVERRNPSLEELLCERYYWSYTPGAFNQVAAGFNKSTTQGNYTFPHRVPMRTGGGTLTVADATAWFVYHEATSTATTALAIITGDQHSVSIIATVAAGLTAGQGSHLVMGGTPSKISRADEL